MYRYASIGIVLIVAMFGGVYGLSHRATIGRDVRYTQFKTEALALGLLHIPIRVSSEGSHVLSVRIDLNGDGVYADDEKVITDMRVPLTRGEILSVPVQSNRAPAPEARIEIVINDAKYRRTLTSIDYATETLNVDSVTKPTESMKEGEALVSLLSDIPETQMRDKQQGTGLCVPRAITSSLLWLADYNGMSHTLPDEEQLMTDLTEAFEWEEKNGVVVPTFNRTLPLVVRDLSLPIRVEGAGDIRGNGTMEALELALVKDPKAAVLLRVQLLNQQLEPVGGHLISIREVRRVDNRTFIDVYDSRTPQGLDVYELQGNMIVGYPTDGLAVASIGYALTWEKVGSKTPLR